MRSFALFPRLLLGGVVVVLGCGGKDAAGDPTDPTDPGSGTTTGPGATWTLFDAPNTAYWNGLIYNGSTFLAVGNGYRSTSTSGTSWTTTASASPAYFHGEPAFANGMFVDANQLGVSTSSNGSSWSYTALCCANFGADAQSLTAAAYGNGVWVVADDRFLSEDVAAFFVSSNGGTSWQQVLTTLPYAHVTNVAFGNGVFVAVGWGGFLATSTNGTSWTLRSLGNSSDNSLDALIFANGMFAIGTYLGNVYRSTNGVTWTKASAAFSGIKALAYGNGTWVAAGYGIWTSPDAITWTFRPWTGGGEITGLAYGNGKFVAIGGYSWATSP